MREKNGKFIFFIRLNTINIFILIFGIVFIVNFIDFKLQFSSRLFNKTSEKRSSNMFLYLISRETPQLRTVIDQENTTSILIPHVLFTSMTNVWPDDIRMYLGGEHLVFHHIILK